MRRRTVFLKNHVPFHSFVDRARINEVRPIKTGDYGFIWTAKGICLGQGSCSQTKLYATLVSNVEAQQ